MKEWLEKYPVASVMLLVLLCVAPILAFRDFSPANELRYLSIADEALFEGNWFTFSYQGEPYADKPPLFSRKEATIEGIVSTHQGAATPQIVSR